METLEENTTRRVGGLPKSVTLLFHISNKINIFLYQQSLSGFLKIEPHFNPRKTVTFYSKLSEEDTECYESVDQFKTNSTARNLY